MLNTSKASRLRQPNSEPRVYVLSMFLGTRSFTTSHGGRRGTSFWKCTECEGGHTGLAFYVRVVKLYYDWSKSTFLQKKTKKIHPGGSLSAIKDYPCKARPRNLSAIYPTRNVACMYVHTPMHTAEIWKKYWHFFFYFLKAFLSLNRDKYFALYWCFYFRISFLFFLIKWSEMDSNVKPQTLDFWPSQLQLCPGVCVMGSHNFIYLSCVNIRSWAELQRYEETANSFTKDYDRWEIKLSCNSAYEHKDVIDIDGIITEFASLKGRQFALCL